MQDEAVVIRRWDWSETSQTVSLLTREHGILRGIAKGAKREKGSFSGGLDLLTRGQIVAIVKPGRDLATLAQWSLEETFRHLRQSLAANRAGLYFADLIHHVLSQHEANAPAYDTFVRGLRDLADRSMIGLTMLRFQWSMLVHAGYQPILDRDAETGQQIPEDVPTVAFSAEAGGVVTDNGATGRWRVRRETIALLVAIAADEAPVDMPDATIDRANRLCAAYWREVLGREIASMRFAFSDGLQGPARPQTR